jgi:hypothetical protein
MPDDLAERPQVLAGDEACRRLMLLAELQAALSRTTLPRRLELPVSTTTPLRSARPCLTSHPVLGVPE